MTMQECYKAIGGNYEAVLGRLHSEALIQRFTLKFLEDQSYLQLKQTLENKNYEDAFRSAHTLKGVCQNLSFDRLYEVSNELTELLRDFRMKYSVINPYRTRFIHRVLSKSCRKKSISSNRTVA